MAIPISMPNSEDVDESYRSLDLLLEQLLMALRQVLMHRRREAQNTSTTNPRQRRPPQTDTTLNHSQPEDTTSRILPDLVLDAEPDCSMRMNHKEASLSSAPTSPSTSYTNPHPPTTTHLPQTWVQVGVRLRRIADRFRATNTSEQKAEGKSSRMKDASLLSLLCPPLGGSVWTTVAILVGWGLLSRTR